MAADLAVIVISFDEEHWLSACLESVSRCAGALSVQMIVVDNGVRDGTRRLVGGSFSNVELVQCENRGFGHANNRGLERVAARHVLFLNVDTELRSGSLEQVVAELDARPELGAVGLRQRRPDGELLATIRRFPSWPRALAEALGLDHLGLGERVAPGPLYEREQTADWLPASCLMVRGEALHAVGFGFDERFFMNGEDVDLCRRIRAAGYRIVFRPEPELIHHVHGGRRRLNPQLAGHLARSRRIYAQTHMASGERALYLLAVSLRYALRGQWRELRELLATPAAPPAFASSTSLRSSGPRRD